MNEQYKAIVALYELINDKGALKEAAEKMSEALVLTEIEEVKRNEYNEIIERGNKILASIKTQQGQLDDMKSNYEKAIVKFHDELTIFNMDRASALASLVSRQEDLTKKDAELLARERGVEQEEISQVSAQKSLAERENSVANRERICTERENKINAIISAGK